VGEQARAAEIAPQAAPQTGPQTGPVESPSTALPERHAYIQYGVAFTAEYVAAPGPICADPGNPCILGSGGGITVRVGWRPAEEWYLGGAYELSKQDPNQLYRLGILQQARAEGRRYFRTGRTASPFVLAGAGLAGYGNEWAIDTWGPSVMFGAGLELDFPSGTVIGFSAVYRPTYLKSFVDTIPLQRDGGFAHFVGFEIALEKQDAL
jgi:hypothetical protein